MPLVGVEGIRGGEIFNQLSGRKEGGGRACRWEERFDDTTSLEKGRAPS